MTKNQLSLLVVSESEILLHTLEEQKISFPVISIFYERDFNNANPRIRQQNFDVILIDTAHASFSTDNHIKGIASIAQNIKVMALVRVEEEKQCLELIRAGAATCIQFEKDRSDYLEICTQLHGGSNPVSATVAKFLIDEIQSKESALELGLLTPREKQVLLYIEQGKSYKSIGAELRISRNTVHSHVKSIYAKLGAVGKIDALIKARVF